MAASIALGCGGKSYSRVRGPLAAGTPRSRDPLYCCHCNSFMQITDFFYSENFSIGAAAGEGLRYRFVVANATGRVEYLEELVDGRMACRTAAVVLGSPWRP